MSSVDNNTPSAPPAPANHYDESGSYQGPPPAYYEQSHGGLQAPNWSQCPAQGGPQVQQEATKQAASTVFDENAYVYSVGLAYNEYDRIKKNPALAQVDIDNITSLTEKSKTPVDHVHIIARIVRFPFSCLSVLAIGASLFVAGASLVGFIAIPYTPIPYLGVVVALCFAGVSNICRLIGKFIAFLGTSKQIGDLTESEEETMKKIRKWCESSPDNQLDPTSLELTHYQLIQTTEAEGNPNDPAEDLMQGKETVRVMLKMCEIISKFQTEHTKSASFLNKKILAA